MIPTCEFFVPSTCLYRVTYVSTVEINEPYVDSLKQKMVSFSIVVMTLESDGHGSPKQHDMSCSQVLISLLSH